MKNKKQKGIALLELILVLGIFLVLIGILSSAFNYFQRESALNNSAQEVINTLRLAQNKTLASERASQWGVYFDISSQPQQYILFKGESYLNRDSAFDEIFQLPNSVEISEINLEGGSFEVVFDRLVGTTWQFGSLTLKLKNQPEETRSIGIQASGKITLGVEGEGPTIEFTGGTTDGDLANFPNNSGWGDPGQSFTTLEEEINVSQVKLFLKKATVNPSDIYLEIRQDSPVGTILGSSEVIDSQSLPETLSWIDFEFSSPITLASSTQYFLRLRSIPESTVAFSGAEGTIHWGYLHSATGLTPPYEEGDAWRYIGANNDPSNPGELLLGPDDDQYDFSFKIIGSPCGPPENRDSRHVHFDYSRLISTSTESLILTFTYDSSTLQETILIADNLKEGQIFWEGEINVGGEIQKLKIHTHRLNNPDTQFSIHRDRRYNNKALKIEISGDSSGSLIEYSADGLSTTKTSIYASEPQWQ